MPKRTVSESPRIASATTISSSVKPASDPPLEGGSKNSERSEEFFGVGHAESQIRIVRAPNAEICSARANVQRACALANFDPPSRGGLVEKALTSSPPAVFLPRPKPRPWLHRNRCRIHRAGRVTGRDRVVPTGP